MTIIELIFEHNTVEQKLARERRRAGILRKAGDSLKRLNTDPTEVQYLLGRANKADQDVVNLQCRLDGIAAKLESEKRTIEARGQHTPDARKSSTP